MGWPAGQQTDAPSAWLAAAKLSPLMDMHVDMRCPVAGLAEMVVVRAEASSDLTGVAATAVVQTAAVGSAKSQAEALSRVTTGKALSCTVDGAGSRL